MVGSAVYLVHTKHFTVFATERGADIDFIKN